MDDSAGDNIDQHANDADREVQSSEKAIRITNDESHLVATRWWFASSAFPMIAGTLGPTASAFSICALVRPWVQRLEPGGDVTKATFLKDPVWLTTVNAVQLVVALISNVFLLLNMTRRVRFTVAQPITIVGWYISAICLLSLNACAAGPLLEGFDYPVSEHVWSQAFYYGIWAAILYFIDASLMLVTFYGAWSGRYSKDFMLSTSQRTLMLQTIAFLVYLLLGALIFSIIEGWDYLDAVYWADVTLFTVGFGDIYPTTPLSQALMIPYALIGVITLGLVIGSIRSMILERGKRRMDSRMEEKKRHQVVKLMVRRGTDAILRPIPTDETASPEIELSPRQAKFFKRAPTNEFERREQEFQLMREIQRRATIRRRWIDLAISTSCWLILWLLGAYIFMQCEKPYQDWTYFQSFYFSFVALVTIGYGDKSPVSNGGRSFFVFWSLLALPTMTVLISNAGDTVVKFIKDATLRVGSVTILPGEEGFRDHIKFILYRASRGHLFPNHSKEPDPPQVKRRAFLTDLEAGSTSSIVANNEEQPTDPACPPRHQQQRTLSSLSSMRNPHADLPTGAAFHYLLACEIQAVASHLHESKPRRYTFEEWAWYLKLIGEDERDPELHRGPKAKEVKLDPNHEEGGGEHKHRRRRRRRRRKKRAHEGIGRERAGSLEHSDGEEGENKWSWVGTKNPLMGGKEESEWIMERLTERLKEAIEDDHDEEW